MAGIAVTIRNLLHDDIETARVAGTYTYNGFRVEKTHKPFDNRESSELSDGKVYLMAGGFDESLLTRCTIPEVTDLPILVFMQRSIEGSDSLERGDQFLELMEDISSTARDLTLERLTWQRTEQMKDSNNYPFVFSMIREQSVLQLGFIAHYHYNWTE